MLSCVFAIGGVLQRGLGQARMESEGEDGALDELVENTTVIAVNVTDDTMLRPGDPVSRWTVSFNEFHHQC